MKKNSRITISFFEIYNEKIFDLLAGGMKALEIRESKAGEIAIAGLSSIEVVNMKEAISYLAEGIKVTISQIRTGPPAQPQSTSKAQDHTPSFM